MIQPVFSPTESLLAAVPRRPHRDRRSGIVRQIYEDLHVRIVGLELPPGTVISKRDLANEFAVSETPVREALLRLEESGLVDIFPQSRTVVARIDIQSAKEAHFLRLGVEIEVARSLAPRISEPEIAALLSAIDEQRDALNLGDLAAFTAADNWFHQLSYDLAGVSGLWSLIEAKRAHLDRLRRLKLPTKGKAQAVIKDHVAIADALARHDPMAAEKAIRDHLRNAVSATEIDDIRSAFPEYFEMDRASTPRRAVGTISG